MNRNTRLAENTPSRIALTVGISLLFGLGLPLTTLAQEDMEELPEGFVRQSASPLPEAEQIEAGKRVYFTKCVWCHGVEGTGDGPGAVRLWPRPRNFESGTFKIRHTASGQLPLINVDLLQTVTHGLPGSAMPSWEGILTEQQRKDVLAFVTTQLVKDREWQDTEFEDFFVLELDKLEAIPNTPESIKRGSELVVEVKCIECHGLEGRGDGNAFNLKDDWGFSIQPADWHKCWNFRGSRQDAYNVKNIFRTFSTGINGTPMPSFADTTSIEDRWHIANYVQSLCERMGEVVVAGGEVSDEIATTLSTALPLPIDPLTDKPKGTFVIPSKFIEGDLPTDENGEAWKTAPRKWVALGGQITHKPRNFVNRIDDVWVQSVYNKDHILFMFKWNDRTKSIQEGDVDWDPDEVNLEDYGIEEQQPHGSLFSEEQFHPESLAAKQKDGYAVYNDGIAFQFPVKWQELPAPRKPRYFWGDDRFSVDITKWTADGTLAVYEGTGWDQDFTELDFQEEVSVLKAEWVNGRWTVIIKRPLTGDYEEVAYLQNGQYIPMVFFAWDGHNGDVGRKMAVSAIYYLVMEPPVENTVFIYPTIMAVGIIVLEGWVLGRRSNRRKEKGEA